MTNEINQSPKSHADEITRTTSSSETKKCASSDTLNKDPTHDECTTEAYESRDNSSEIAATQRSIAELRKNDISTSDDVTFYKAENNKFKVHLEKSEIVKLELLNRCNQLEIESRKYEKDRASISKIIKENKFLNDKITRMDKAYAKQLSVMADTILKMEAMSQKKDLKNKERIESLQCKLRKMKTSGKEVVKCADDIEDDDRVEDSLENTQARRIAELETQLEENRIALSAFKSCNTYISDMVRRDEEELRGELVKSTRETDKFMSELESLELDMTSDLRHLENELSQY